MASTRSRREVRAKSPNLSDVEDAGSDSDYSPGSLMIDMGADGRWCTCIQRSVNHNSLGSEQASGLYVNQLPDVLDVFWPIYTRPVQLNCDCLGICIVL